jgi:single-stranded-DNA-specific exonuclease
MQAEALAAIEELHLGGELAPALCLYDPNWHEGVIGILASRLKERFQRPAIAFAPGAGGDLKGSARSVSGIHIRDVLDAVATRHPGLISRFGGHAMAAGLVLPATHFDAFAVAFNQALDLVSDNAIDAGIVMSDGELPEDTFDLQLAESIQRLGPWGQGFPEPCFDGRFEVVSARIVGSKHFKLLLRAAPSGGVISAIYFNPPRLEPPPPGKQLHLAYRLTVNDFQDVNKLELIVVHIDWSPGP